MRILFMGTPDFAVYSLKALVEAGHEIVGVVTQADKPKGRGYVLTPPPVKAYALEQGLTVYQPATLRNGAFDAEIAVMNPDCIAVVAFGKLLPPSVLNAPRYGCVNVHGSLLPLYRGAAPMQRAIMEGQPKTGITTMYMAEGMDTGDMLLKAEVEIAENDNFEIIHDKLAQVGADLLVRTLRELEAGTLVPVPQDDSLATHAAKIEKEDCLINFNAPVKQVHDIIRGLSPMPLAFTHTPDGKLLKVPAARRLKYDGQHGTPGQVLSLDTGADGGIEVACAEGTLLITRVTPEGKGQMSAADYIRGRKIAVGDILS